MNEDRYNEMLSELAVANLKAIRLECKLRQAIAYMEGYFGTEPEGEGPLKYLKSLLEDL